MGSDTGAERSAPPTRDALYDELVTLALPARAETPLGVHISAHALRRYRERVDGRSRAQVTRRLRRLLDGPVDWEVRPRPWTTVVLHDGVTYGYPVDRPDVCLLIRGGVLVTVLSERFCRTGRRPPHPHHTHDPELLAA